MRVLRLFITGGYAMKRFYFSKQLIFCCALVFFMASLLFSAVSYAQSQKEEWDRAVVLFKEGERLNKSDFRGAIEIFEEALSIFQRLGGKRATGPVFGALGPALAWIDQFPSRGLSARHPRSWRMNGKQDVERPKSIDQTKFLFARPTLAGLAELKFRLEQRARDRYAVAPLLAESVSAPRKASEKPGSPNFIALPA